MRILNIFALISLASATLFAKGPCPDIKPVDKFDINAYAQDTWYEIARYPNDWEGRGDCVAMVFNPDGGVKKFKLTDVVNKSLDYYEGYIQYADGVGTSGLINHFSKSYQGAEGTNVVPVYILSIDYNKYSIGYECKYDAKNNLHHEYAWVMSRTKNLDGETKNFVDNYLKSSTLIDQNKFIWIHFSNDTCAVKS